MLRLLTTLAILLTSLASYASFVQDQDLISLHYDHAPDRDDGHATVAALAVTSARGIVPHVVSGAYGSGNSSQYQPAAVAVMQEAWGSAWVDAHANWQSAVNSTAARWINTLLNGGDIWVAEGGQSDFTADVLRSISNSNPGINTPARIHVIQHSTWNENQANQGDLNYTRSNTDYIKIADGNGANATADLNQKSASFVQLARASQFGSAWNAAFSYLNPDNKLDFSDTVELLHLLGIDTNQIATVDDFAAVYFSQSTTPVVDTPVVVEPVVVEPVVVEPVVVAAQQPDTTQENTQVDQIITFADCSDSVIDFDNDGFGWENNQSCIVPAPTSTITQPETTQPQVVATDLGPQYPTCSDSSIATDGNGYGWENNRTCVIDQAINLIGNNASVTQLSDQQPIAPADNPLLDFPDCGTSIIDDNGDGYGWENNQTCVIQSSVNTTTTQAATQQTLAPIDNPLINFPVCSANVIDENGDGYGWENNQTCVIQTGLNTSTAQAATQQALAPIDNPLINFPVCSVNVIDENGDGYGWENNQTCVIQTGVNTSVTQTTTQQTLAPIDNPLINFPVCSANVIDENGDGYGWENNQTCVIQTGVNASVTQTTTQQTLAPIDNPLINFPVCSTTVMDENDDGYGWENNQTCVIATGF